MIYSICEDLRQYRCEYGLIQFIFFMGEVLRNDILLKKFEERKLEIQVYEPRMKNV